MSNLHTKKELKRINLRSDMPFYIITPNPDRQLKRRVVITYITEEEESLLDSNKTITIERGGVVFTINKDNVEYYGNIDFNRDSDDMYTIADAHWFSTLGMAGVWLPSRYSYRRHCAYSDLSVPRMYDTFKPELVAQYGHGCIGKPERCVIFKHLWRV